MANLLARLTHSTRRRWKRAVNNVTARTLARSVEEYAPLPLTPPVVFFNASTRLGGLSLNAGFSLLSALSLRLSGTPVVHFVCQSGMSRCVLGTDRHNPYNPPPCIECVSQSRSAHAHSNVRWFDLRGNPALAHALEGLDLDDLIRFEYQGVPLGKLVLPSLRWILRRHHLQDDEPTRFLFNEYIHSAWNIVQQFGSLLDEVKPMAVLVFNGMFFPEAAARWAAQQRGLRVVSHEVGLRAFTGFFTSGEATAYPMEIPESFELSAAQEKRLDEYLKQRFKGNFSMAGVRFWPEMHSLSHEFWQRANKFKQIVAVFTNVIFDTSQGHANVVFEHMFAWLDLVAEIIREHPDTFFVIRAHPDESRPGKESLESVADWIKQNAVEQLPNVLFVGPDEYFSSYELIQKSKFVMVYNSTIGLEASILGAAVLCGGKARFTQLPTVYFPLTAAKYLEQAQELLASKEIKVPEEFRHNARRLLYFQLFKTSLPFDDLLQEDGIYPGYVAMKQIRWQALLAENSETLSVIVDGIVKDRHFLLEE